MQSRRVFLKASCATGVAVLSNPVFSDAKSESIRYWDNHAGYGYAGPQDVELLDHWRSAGMSYLSINVGYDAVPWSTTVRAIADYTKGIQAHNDYVLCPTFADVQRAWRAGKLALTFDIEGMGALNGDLAMVQL